MAREGYGCFRHWLGLLCVVAMTLALSAACADTLTLPSGLKTLEEQAFMGDTSLDEVVLPGGMTKIGEKAFANSSVKSINLPTSLTFIADNAFDGSALEAVTAEKGTYGYTWAVEHGYIKPFIVTRSGGPRVVYMNVETDMEWTASTDDDWLMLTMNIMAYDKKQISWSGDATMYVWLDYLPVELTSRTGSVKFVCGDEVYTYTFVQKRTDVPMQGVSLSRTTAEIAQGTTVSATVDFVPSYATDRRITWSSSNTNIATVDANGVVTGRNAGTATITVKTTDGGFTASYQVTVKAPVTAVTGVTLNKTSTTINKGKTETLTATVAPSDATNKNVTWTSSNTNVATVSSSGVVTAKASGTATITVRTADGGKTATCTVKVTSPVATAPTITGSPTSENDAITVQWSAVPNAVSYTITATHTGNGWQGVYVNAVSPWTTDWFGDGTYSITVTAIGDTSVSNNQKTSEAKSVTVKSNTIKTGPTPTVSVSGSNATLQWTEVDKNATWYEIELWTSANYVKLLNGNGGSYTKKIGGSNYDPPALHHETKYTFTGLSSGVYFVKIAGVNAGGHWCFGNAVGFVIGTAANYTIQSNPTLNYAGGTDSITCYWNAIENATVYDLYLMDSNGNRLKSVSLVGTSYTFTGLQEGTYLVEVCATNSYIQNGTNGTAWRGSGRKSITVGSVSTSTKYIHGIPHWMQTDPRWGSQYINPNNTGDLQTISSVGCLLTCVAMSEAYRTGNESNNYPHVLKTRCSFSGNNLIWSSLPVNYGMLTYNFSLANLLPVIKAKIDQEVPVIIGGRGGNSTHWVLVYGYQDLNPNNMSASCFLINDPGNTSRTTLQDFLNRYPVIDACRSY